MTTNTNKLILHSCCAIKRIEYASNSYFAVSDFRTVQNVGSLTHILTPSRETEIFNLLISIENYFEIYFGLYIKAVKFNLLLIAKGLNNLRRSLGETFQKFLLL